MNWNEVLAVLAAVFEGQSLKKIVLSKSKVSGILKKEVHLFLQNEQVKLQISTYTADNKVLHQNLDLDKESAGIVLELLQTEFKQCNIYTAGGDCEIKVGKKSLLIHNNIKNTSAVHALSEHNKAKQYLFEKGVAVPFLIELGIMDANGRIYDKMQDKFKQINRFVALIEDVFSVFDAGKTIHILDLCCGKSYLTFAVHHYFTQIKGCQVDIIGVDLKDDVISYCSAVAEKLHLEGLRFLHGDILQYTPEQPVDMVISLHACDVATDVVLASAVRWNSKLILSSPCCHHELSQQIQSDRLEVLLHYPILKQKLAELATDALRGQLLECHNYTVQMIEFIDPENTPKNLLIRAVKNKKTLSPKEAEQRKKAYDGLCEELSVHPSMKGFLAGEA